MKNFRKCTSGMGMLCRIINLTIRKYVDILKQTVFKAAGCNAVEFLGERKQRWENIETSSLQQL